LDAAAADPAVEHIVSGEGKLFAFRCDALKGQEAQLGERIGQLKLEIEGLEGQSKAKTREIELVHKELDGVRELWEKNLVQLTRLTSLERDAARLDGEAGKLESTIAETRGKITETELQILQLDQSMRSDDSKELADIRSKVSELLEKKVAAMDQLSRVELKAPQSGVVHQLTVHTKGGVISSGEQVMLIVPENDNLTVEARILPKDIDQVHLGQRATLRFTTFNQRTTPEINGEVSRVAADVTDDDRTDQPYYLVRIKIDDMNRLGKVTLTPGMPVDAFIETGNRSMISYLTKPLADQARRAFQER
ncbi:MAG: HlyD family type I secretion periplasmic adaptor subunit, partial [Hansschlegelia sp.]